MEGRPGPAGCSAMVAIPCNDMHGARCLHVNHDYLEMTPLYHSVPSPLLSCPCALGTLHGISATLSLSIYIHSCQYTSGSDQTYMYPVQLTKEELIELALQVLRILRRHGTENVTRALHHEYVHCCCLICCHNALNTSL